MQMFFYLIDLLFTIYTFMILARILSSWIPQLAESKAIQFVAFYTDPYLKIFRRIIPPLGIIDLSPMAALISLQLIQYFILGFFRG
jgi:YggT family protein